LLILGQVLGKLDALVKDWCRRVSATKGFTEPLLSEARGARARRRRGASNNAGTLKALFARRFAAPRVPPRR
jgi:hypothetical protein